MLALPINTKSMKGSTVLRSWKDWASKLHPQLPLSPKESHRLLTALTGSFRRHLDEVHPTTAPDSKLKLGAVSVLTTSPHAIHSSAISADKHLASVLTNPLLNKRRPNVSTPDQDLANAKAELLMNPAKIPVEVLEEYNARGAATIPIARLCLHTFEDSLAGLSIDKQREAVAEAEPGRRTLLWLWRSGLYQTETFRQSGSFMHLLTFALMREGLDKYLWEWLCLDMGYVFVETPSAARQPTNDTIVRCDQISIHVCVFNTSFYSKSSDAPHHISICLFDGSERLIY